MSAITDVGLAVADADGLAKRTAEAESLAKSTAQELALADMKARVLLDRSATLDAECAAIAAARKAGAVNPAYDTRLREITMARVSLGDRIAEASREAARAASLASHVSAHIEALASLRAEADKAALTQQGEPA